jgi:hypothetical protein
MARFNYQEWYENNKKRLSSKKKDRYHSDPEYRAKVIERSREQRAAAREKRKAVVDEYAFTILDVAAQLGVTVWVVRDWRRKGYFPEPKLRGGKLLFTQNQIGVLMHLVEFFKNNDASNVSGLEDVKILVSANWDN